MSYKKAITILTNLETFEQYRTIVIKLAQQHPSILVSLTSKEEVEAGEQFAQFSDNIRMTAAFIYHNPGSKVEGIKHIRNTFGFGLKEAKDVFEYVQSGHRGLDFLSHSDKVIDIGTELRNCYMKYY